MGDTILNKLEASRKELLDLGLRNPLLNYKSSKSRGVSIVLGKSASIFDLLVNQEKAMSFLGRPVKKDSIEIEVVELSQPQLEESYHIYNIINVACKQNGCS